MREELVSRLRKRLEEGLEEAGRARRSLGVRIRWDAESDEVERTPVPVRPLLGPNESNPLELWYGGAPPEGMPWPLSVADALELARGAVGAYAEALADEIETLAERMVAPERLAGTKARLVSGDGVGVYKPLERWTLARSLPAYNDAAECSLAALLAWTEARTSYGLPAAVDVHRLAEWACKGEPLLGGAGGVFALYAGGAPPADCVSEISSNEGRLRTYRLLDLAYLYLSERAEYLDAEHPEYAARRAHSDVSFLLSGDPAAPPTDYLAAVRAVLESVAAEDDLAEEALAAPARLAGYAAELAAEARRLVGPLLKRDAEERLGELLAWDALYLEELARFGDTGFTIAEEARARAEQRANAAAGRELFNRPAWELWKLWREPNQTTPPRWLRLLARTLWGDRWRGRLAFERAKHSAALPLLLRRAFRDLSRGEELAERGTGSFEYLTPDGAIVARFAAPVLDAKRLKRMRVGVAECLRDGVAELRGVTFERVIRGLARKAFQQASEGMNPYIRAVYVGGWQGFANEHGINGRDRALLPALFEALCAYRGGARDLPPIIGGYWLDSAGPGTKAELRIDIGEALAPGFVSSAPVERKGDAWLLPVLPVPVLSWANRNQYAALCDLQWEILAFMRGRADEYVERGGVFATDTELIALADRTGLERATVRRAIEKWSQEAEAWLSVTDGRLALIDEGAAALLRQAGGMVATGREDGKRSGAVRRGELPPSQPKRRKTRSK